MLGAELGRLRVGGVGKCERVDVEVPVSADGHRLLGHLDRL